MVKRSKKSKSKRMPLRKKYKILRKVKEHHKKKAKEEKKRAALGLGKKGASEKDPGIPNAWPFKEQELAALEARRQRAVEEKERAKEAKKAAREAAREAAQGGAQANGHGADASAEAEAEAEEVEMQRMVGDAGERSREFGRMQEAEAQEDGGFRKRKAPEDGSRRAFFREVLRVVEAADVVIQVLDARDPLGCRCPELERLVLRGGTGAGGGPKRLILLLNKIDLVPREVVEKWLRFLREELPTVAFKCSVQAQRANLGHTHASRAKGKGKAYGGLKAQAGGGADSLASGGSTCLGAETLIQLLKNYCRNKDIKTGITVGVVGLPNVGKSSLINSLKRARVASVGSTPGVTRALQEVHLDKHVKLLDCPGVVMSASSADDMAAAALRNAIRVEQLTDPLAPVRRIVHLCSKDALMSAYKIARFADVDEFVRSVAFARGRLKKGGIPDTAAAARVVLSDWNDGRIPFFTSPPKRRTQDEEGATTGPLLVQQWGQEFDAHAVFLAESSAVLANLAAMAERPEGIFAELPAGTPAVMDTGEAEDGREGKGGIEDGVKEDGEARSEEEGVEMEADTAVDTPHNEEEVRSDGTHKQQNEALYNAEGIRNPHAARADKRRRKKEKKAKAKAKGDSPAGADVATMVEEYDFSEAFQA